MAKQEYDAVSMHSMLENSFTKDWACIKRLSFTSLFF